MVPVMRSVESSTVSRVGYDPRSSSLFVQFTSGALYEYLRVPERVWRGLLRASSHGRYFNTHVKDAGFRFRRLDCQSR